MGLLEHNHIVDLLSDRSKCFSGYNQAQVTKPLDHDVFYTLHLTKALWGQICFTEQVYHVINDQKFRFPQSSNVVVVPARHCS